MKKYIYSLIFLLCSVANAGGFVENTLVKTPQGYTKIEDLKVGDEVLSCDYKEHCIAKKVTATHLIKAQNFVVVQVGGDGFACDKDQLVLDTQKREWVKISELASGDLLVTSKIFPASIGSVDIWNDAPVTLHAITVEDNENFYVTREDILVHNFAQAIAQGLKWVFQTGAPRVLAGAAPAGVIPFVIGPTVEIPQIQRDRGRTFATQAEANKYYEQKAQQREWDEDRLAAGYERSLAQQAADQDTWEIVNYARELLTYLSPDSIEYKTLSVAKRHEVEARRKSINQVVQEIIRGRAPKCVDQAHPPHVPGAPNEEDHIHFDTGYALNRGGSIRHPGDGPPKWTQRLKEWLKRMGWKLPPGVI